MIRYIILIFSLIYFTACEEKVERSDAYGNFEVTATVLSSEANGRLLYFNVEEGHKLKAGSLVAIVDTTHLILERQSVKAKINTLPKKLRNTLADIEVLQNQKSNLIRERDRVQRLIEKKAALPKQLDDMNGQIEVIDKQISAIRSQTEIGNRAILSEQEPLLAQIAMINEGIRKSYIYNPFEGTVLTKLSEPQEIVGRGTPLYRIGKLDIMTLRFYASAVQLQNIKLGQKIQVLVDQGQEDYKELEGTIKWISEQAEFTPKTIQTKEDRVNLVYAVKASVANPDGLLKIGMPAEVNFEKKELSEKESQTE